MITTKECDCKGEVGTYDERFVNARQRFVIARERFTITRKVCEYKGRMLITTEGW